MINYYRNEEIDREQWDNCIKSSAGYKPYALSWYLDIMAPGWNALIEDDYETVFPLPCKMKFGIRYIATPVFLQQLGIFSPDRLSDGEINEFIGYVPEFYRLIDLCTAQRIDNDRFISEIRTNYELDLSNSYEKIWDKFSVHCKRNIERSYRNKSEIVSDIKPWELSELFQKNAGKKISGIKERDYQRLNELMDYCVKNKKGRILGVRSPEGIILYGIFTVEIKGRKTMLFVVNTRESRYYRLGYRIVNEIIKESAGSRTILDFAGSSVTSIASFMESFGSKIVPFYRNYCNRFPWPLRLLK